MGEFSIYHWLIVLLIVVLLFGARRIPELFRGLGQGVRYFKEALHASDDSKKRQSKCPA